MPEPRAQRTLVKSPPEIWAEISDAGTLARHLGEFGEIRITEVKAETTVVWEGDTARGTVSLEPSGWGTRVTITAEAKPVEAEAEPEQPASEPIAEAEPAAEAPVAEAEPIEEPAEPVADAEPEPLAEEPTPEPVAATPAPAPRKRGFFARLFGRKAEPAAIAEPPASEDKPASVPPPAPKAPTASVAPPAPAPPVVAETPAAEATPIADASPAVVEPELDGEIVATAAAIDPEHIEAVLVGVLDDLGSAHHRPFSRG
ncbi:hypothetical protein [Baekduia sp. Peel2402]|uniref:hypothetical protein n=1 Tax=Baekduia sp. Peel2402 TaxID=3458296 RepID=UPI00403E6C96